MTLAVGFVGLGAMGRGMARNLHRAGLLRGVWNRTQDPAAELASELGCVAAGSPAELAALCDVVVLCVSADADVLEVVDALQPALRPGSIVIDCSTVSAATAREAARRLAARQVEFLDAPVSGGVEGARDATLAIMVGGAEAALERARPVLEAMGRAVTHFGPSGAGQAAKATNQIMCAGIIQAVGEAMAFAKAEGLPLEALIGTLGKGAGSSWYFVNRAPNMVRGAYPPGFRVRLHDKDLRICRDMAARHGVQLPVVETTLQHYRQLIEQGYGDEDISTIFRLKDALFASAARDTPGKQHR
ncbi:MAG: NAD(P)-dependent oxidoreductase [Steroidobacteraceae bacterium]|nr:NAD(P)-dependent oxidoreductase [Steroidobacteraceae bacterium]